MPVTLENTLSSTRPCQKTSCLPIYTTSTSSASATPLDTTTNSQPCNIPFAKSLAYIYLSKRRQSYLVITKSSEIKMFTQSSLFDITGEIIRTLVKFTDSKPTYSLELPQHVLQGQQQCPCLGSQSNNFPLLLLPNRNTVLHIILSVSMDPKETSANFRFYYQ